MQYIYNDSYIAIISFYVCTCLLHNNFEDTFVCLSLATTTLTQIIDHFEAKMLNIEGGNINSDRLINLE